MFILDRYNPEMIVGVHSVKRNAWGIPYGVVNENEMFIDAAIREAEEESGIEVTTCEVLYGPYITNGHEAVVYIATGYKGSLRSSAEGKVEMIHRECLSTQEPFQHTNRQLLRALARRETLARLVAVLMPV